MFSATGKGTGVYTVTVSGSITANSITISNGSLTLAGASSPSLTINLGGVLINGTTTFDSSLGTVLAGGSSTGQSQTWANNSSQSFVVNSGVQIGKQDTLTLGGSGSGSISGVVSENSASGSNKGKLAKSGAGTWVLSGANTYSGGTTISVGTLEFAKTNSMPSSGTVSVSSSATLAVNAGGTNEWTNGTSGNGTLGGLISGTGGQGSPVSWSSGSILGIDTTNASGGNFSYGGVIGSFNTGGNSVGLTKLGTNTLTLTGANTYTGGTTVSAGTLLANNTTGSATGSGAVMVNSGGTLGGGNAGGTTGFINAGSNNISINAGGTITGATNGTVGALTLIAANLVFNGANSGNLATYVVDISGATSDKLKLTGVLDLSGAFDQITFQGTPDGSTTYILAQYTSETGTFNTFPTLPSGYKLVYGATELDLVPIPEPGTWAAAALVLGALVLSQRRRLSKNLKMALLKSPR